MSNRAALAQDVGLSPRVRGNHGIDEGATDVERSIPARAGEPVPRQAPRPQQPLYPRACGGTTRGAPGTVPPTGLSPRVRGNRGMGEAAGLAGGSIPARAGEPIPGTGHDKTDEVYPRACGGTANPFDVAYGYQGLSPRVRGNRVVLMPASTSRGSIPARAGEP